MILFQCSQCQKPLNVKPELAGKRVKCPLCAKIVQVPEPAVSPVPGSGSMPPPEARTLPPAPRMEISDVPTPPPEDEQTRLPPENKQEGRFQADSESSPTEEYTDFLAPPQQPDEIGRLGMYRVLKVLGAGGMGVVYKAEDPALKRLVAIKAMLPAIAASASAKKRFLREAQAAAAIKHNHIVTIHQVGEDRGVPFLAMEFLKGEPLDERLKRETMLPLAETLRIGREMAEGLAAAHERGLIHRDIKPANTWLEASTGRKSGEFHVKILDFGLARSTTDQAHLTQSGAIIGTPAYMAPEQGRGEKVDARCDLWSLGVVLYRMCTGEVPFKGNDTVSTLMAVALNDPPPPAQINAAVPLELSDLVMKLLEKDPDKRIASAHEVVEALRRLELDQSRQETQVAAGPSAKSVEQTSLPTGAIYDRKAAANPNAKHAGEAAEESLNVRKRSNSRLLVLLALAAAAVAGIVLFWSTPYGIIRIESDDPNVEVVFDKDGTAIKGADKETIRLKAGEHGILIKRGDFSFEVDRFVLKKGETITLKLDFLKGNKMQLLVDGKEINARDFPPLAKKELPGGKEQLAKKFTNSLSMEFALVPKGKSWLGGSNGKEGTTEVNIAQDFYLGVYEVTQEDWHKVMAKNPSLFNRDKVGKEISDDDLKRFPVENISWDEAKAFVKLLNEKVNKDGTEAGWEYRLPTEEQWEYACRGGPMTDKAESAFDFYFDKPSKTFSKEQANFLHSGLKRPSKVGSYPPNRLGLYDMHGNVWEWCEDQFTKGGAARAYRGGCWMSGADYCRAAFRRGDEPHLSAYNIGFRLARVRVAPATARKFTNSLGMEFALVPKGKSWLGGENGKEGTKEVNMTQDFSLGVYEVTQEDWQKIMDKNPSRYSRTGPLKDQVKDVSDADLKRFPVESVTWGEAKAFVAKVNEMLKKDAAEAGWEYRLPTQEQWEYACRGGPIDKSASAFDFYFENPTAKLTKDLARIENASRGPTRVGSYAPNRLGLFDMHGNVSEWCEDCPVNFGRESRGGSFNNSGGSCTATRFERYAGGGNSPTVGLRLARVPIK